MVEEAIPEEPRAAGIPAAEIPAAEIPAARMNARDISASDALLLAYVNGADLVTFLKTLVGGRTSRSQCYTYNRLVKAMIPHNLLPANFAAISYGVMKANQKAQLNSIINALSQELQGKDIFDNLKDAILNRIDLDKPATDVDNEGGVLVNRWALMVEFYVHPMAREELTKYFIGSHALCQRVRKKYCVFLAPL